MVLLKIVFIRTTALLLMLPFLLISSWSFAETDKKILSNAMNSVFDRFFHREKLEDILPLVIGEARDLKTQELVYIEKHYAFDVNKFRNILLKDTISEGEYYAVVYVNPDGETIAEKVLFDKTFNQSLKPQLLFSHYLSGETIKVDPLKTQQKTVWVEYQPSSTESVKSDEISLAEDLVIDAGFNAFITQNWNALTRGKSVSFEYLAPSQLKTFTFVAKSNACKNTIPQTAKIKSSMKPACFSIAPKSWLMRQIIKPISLVYDQSSKRLLRYAGLGNIGDERGEYLKVSIDYVYSVMNTPVTKKPDTQKPDTLTPAFTSIDLLNTKSLHF